MKIRTTSSRLICATPRTTCMKWAAWPIGVVFAAIYLLAHGVIKGLLVYGLVRDELWAFPTGIAIFGAFAFYQMYRYTLVPSGWLIALTVLDVAVILLTLAEWRRVKATLNSRVSEIS